MKPDSSIMRPGAGIPIPPATQASEFRCLCGGRWARPGAAAGGFPL